MGGETSFEFSGGRPEEKINIIAIANYIDAVLTKAPSPLGRTCPRWESTALTKLMECFVHDSAHFVIVFFLQGKYGFKLWKNPITNIL